MDNLTELLRKYGTSEADMEKLLAELRAGMKQRKAEQPEMAIFNAPQLFDAVQAREMGVPLREGWMLKLIADDSERGYKMSFLTSEGWEITENWQYISPEGKKYGYQEMEGVMKESGGIIPGTGGAETVFGLDAVLRYLETDPEGFKADLMEAGRSEESETLLKQLGASEQYIDYFYMSEEEQEILLEDIYAEGRNVGTEAALREMFTGITEEEITEFFAEPAWWQKALGTILKIPGAETALKGLEKADVPYMMGYHHTALSFGIDGGYEPTPEEQRFMDLYKEEMRAHANISEVQAAEIERIFEENPDLKLLSFAVKGIGTALPSTTWIAANLEPSAELMEAYYACTTMGTQIAESITTPLGTALFFIPGAIGIWGKLGGLTARGSKAAKIAGYAGRTVIAPAAGGEWLMGKAITLPFKGISVGVNKAINLTLRRNTIEMQKLTAAALDVERAGQQATVRRVIMSHNEWIAVKLDNVARLQRILKAATGAERTAAVRAFKTEVNALRQGLKATELTTRKLFKALRAGQELTPELINSVVAKGTPYDFVEALINASGNKLGAEVTRIRTNIYGQLLASEAISNIEKSQMVLSGAIPKTYSRLTPAELERLGVRLTPEDAEMLAKIQAGTEKYAYWENLCADEIDDAFKRWSVSGKDIEAFNKQSEAIRAHHMGTDPKPPDMPKGTVKYPGAYKGPEDVRIDIKNELLTPVKESPLDIASAKYLETGIFDDYARLHPQYSELKLKALSDEVRQNLGELIEQRSLILRDIETREQAIATTQISKEQLVNAQGQIAQLRRNINAIDRLMKKLKGGEALTIEDAMELGIALRTTKGGNLVPALRKSGYYVTDEFIEYPGWAVRDPSLVSLNWQDTMSAFECIDSGFSAGVTQKYVRVPSERADLAFSKFNDIHIGDLQAILEKHGMTNINLRKAAWDVIQLIEKEDVLIPLVELLKRPAIAKTVGGYSVKAQRALLGYSQEMRKLLDTLIDRDNAVRVARGQAPIPYRKHYLSWVAETNIWSKVGIRKRTPSEIFRKPPLHDYIHPDSPFNPRALAREGGMAGYEMERDTYRLVSDYIQTTGKDIFYADIVQNAKVHVAALESLGRYNSARWIENWASEVYAGVLPGFERKAVELVPKPALVAVHELRRSLTRAVFPFNWLWNITIQPSSYAFTVGRCGVRDSIHGLDYLVSSEAKQMVRNSYSWITKSKRSGKMAYQDIGTQVARNQKYMAVTPRRLLDSVEAVGNLFTNLVEEKLTGISIRAGYYRAQRMGYKGWALLDEASKMGAKTQSMYNFADVPGVLRNRTITSLFPFQTFVFQSMNFVRELNIIGIRRIVGKAGAYESISATSALGKATIAKRFKMIIEFLACIEVINIVDEKLINRRPWEASSFVPFYSMLTAGTDRSNVWNWPLPAQYAAEWWSAFNDVIKYDNWDDIRQWAIRYHVPGGTQLNRMVDGIIAVVHGEVTDVRGKTMFEIKPEEYWKVITMGPWYSELGREYIDELQESKGGRWYEYTGIPLPKRINLNKEIEDNLAQLGVVDEFGNMYDFADFVSDLRQMRRSVGDPRFNKATSPFIEGFLDAEGIREEFEELPLEGRNEWRRNHPEEDAKLAFWGFPGRIQTMEAYDYLEKLCQQYGVDVEHLSTWLPPHDIAPDYFEFGKIVENFTANSAEAKLFMLTHDDYLKWHQDAYGTWQDIEEEKDRIPYLELKAKWREYEDRYELAEDKDAFLEANPEYATARQKMKGYEYGVPTEFIDLYVEYYSLPDKGYDRERFLKANSAYYGQVWLNEDVLDNDPIDFDEIPTVEEENLLDYYDNIPSHLRLQARCGNEKLDAVLVKWRGLVPAYGTDRCEKY